MNLKLLFFYAVDGIFYAYNCLYRIFHVIVFLMRPDTKSGRKRMHTIYTAVPPKIESSVFLFHKCNPITTKTAIPVAIVPLPGLLMLSLMQYTTNTAIIAGGNDSDTFCTVEGILCFPPKSKNGNARSKKVVIAAIPIKIKSYIVWFIFFLSFFVIIEQNM